MMKMQKTFALNESWLLIDGNNADNPDFHKNGIPKENAVEALLPCYTHMYIPDHVGISWYEKTFNLDEALAEEEVAILHFETAIFRTEVSVNGEMVGEHVGVEDPFYFDITKQLHAGENRIVVRTSKPHEIDVDGYTFSEIPHHNQTKTGMIPGNCYNISGIGGEVELRILPRIYVEDLYLAPNVETGEINMEITISNCGEEADALISVDVRRAPSGEIENSLWLPVSVAHGGSTVKVSLPVPSPRLWSTADPNLYAVTVNCDSLCGTHTTQKNTGFRTFCVGEDGYFYLNGERIYVCCSHTGNYMPESTDNISRDPSMLRKDFLLAKATGFNMVRFIAGVAIPVQLDLCDEIGLMIYEEPVAGWCSQNGPHTAELYKQDLLSLVKRDRSHPCVTIWGLLNETPSDGATSVVCETARDSLPDLRKLDDTRLVLFSSGRWDHFPTVGSLANPGSDKWQNFWGNDGDADCNVEELGDRHFYPFIVPPVSKVIDHMRSFGKGQRGPIFVSEIGVGSALDVVSMTRWADQADLDPNAPDIKAIRQMKDAFMEDLERYDFLRSVPFPAELMRGSMKNHIYYRTMLFDILRGNPKVCGISLTGLLDHSICGEGLWMMNRTLKPGIADTLEDGFSTLRWNMFLSKPAVWAGEKLGVEASLASVDVLKVGKEYTARAGIVTPEGLAVDVRTYKFTVTEEQAKTMVIPVFFEEWDTTGLAAGEYIFRAEIMEDANPSGCIRTFHICEKAQAKDAKNVYAAGLTQEDIEAVSGLGFAVKALEEYDSNGVILAGNVDAELAEKLQKMINDGACVVAARLNTNTFAPPPIWFENKLNGDILNVLPEERRPEICLAGDWLYHRETIMRPDSPLFKGMRAGLADAPLYTGVTTGAHFKAEGAKVPDVTHAMAFMPGNPAKESYLGGFTLGEYNMGKGKFVLTTFSLLDNAAKSPYAAKLLINILENV